MEIHCETQRRSIDLHAEGLSSRIPLPEEPCDALEPAWPTLCAHR